MRKNRKRIFILNQTDKSQKFGVGKYIAEMVAEARKRRTEYEMVVINIGSMDTWIPHKLKIGNIIYLNIPRPFFIKTDFIQGLSNRFSKGVFCLLLDIFQISEKDIFHFNNNMQYFLIKKLKEATPATIIYTVHVSLWKVIFNNNRDDFLLEWENNESHSRGIMNIRTEAENCKLADRVICLTASMELDVEKYYEIPKRKILKVFNGISNKKEKIEPEKVKILRRKLGLSLDDNEFVLLYIGRLNMQKGVTNLIKAFERLVFEEEYTDIKLILVGEGVLENELIKQGKRVKNNLIFTGYLNPKEIHIYYNLANTIIFPSFNEQSSYVMLEAMKYQVPMIVTDIDAFSVLKNEVSCLKIDLESKNKLDIISLINNIKRMRNKVGLRRQIAENAFRLFQKNFKSSKMFDDTYVNNWSEDF